MSEPKVYGFLKDQAFCLKSKLQFWSIKNYPLIFQADSNVMVAANSQGTIKVLELV